MIAAAGYTLRAGFAVPAHAVFTTGHRNRFGDPRGAVTARYFAAGAAAWRTDRDGAVTVTIATRGVTVTRHRDEQRRYWR